MTTIQLRLDRVLQDSFDLKALNLLFIFQVNCPGCFIYGFPFVNSLYLSVCDGAVVLGKARLLENLSATTHHMDVERLREVAPNTLIKENVRIVDNNHIIVAAGVSAGIDLSLYVVSKLLGKEWAAKTARAMEYDFVA